MQSQLPGAVHTKLKANTSNTVRPPSQNKNWGLTKVANTRLAHKPESYFALFWTLKARHRHMGTHTLCCSQSRVLQQYTGSAAWDSLEACGWGEALSLQPALSSSLPSLIQWVAKKQPLSFLFSCHHGLYIWNHTPK